MTPKLDSRAGQDAPKCPQSDVEAFRRHVSECGLKLPFRCAWRSANALLADLLDAPWPRAWNQGVDASACAPYNFSAADLEARFVPEYGTAREPSLDARRGTAA